MCILIDLSISLNTILPFVFQQEMVNGERQVNGDGGLPENLKETSNSSATTTQSTPAAAQKLLMVINKDGSKTIMALVSGKNTTESDSASSLVADASNDSQDSNSGTALY